MFQQTSLQTGKQSILLEHCYGMEKHGAFVYFSFVFITLAFVMSFFIKIEREKHCKIKLDKVEKIKVKHPKWFKFVIDRIDIAIE